jgi:hypothetical protein
MLIDNIKKQFNILKDTRNKDKMYPIRGELEVIGMRNGKVFHYDKGPNMVTAWAKHSMMHILSGESFTNQGTQRTLAGAHHSAQFVGDSYYNNDGTMLSNYQYFDNPTFPSSLGWWSMSDSVIAPATYTGYNYPFFPTKMLFGTGFEYSGWSGDSTYFAKYTQQGFGISNFTTALITDASNWYSNNFDAVGDAIVKMKTMNDIYSNTLVTPSIMDADFAVQGAVKNGRYVNNKADSQKLQIINGNWFSGYNYWGVGYPSFVYARREARFYQAGTEIALDFDVNLHNKITYSVTLPEQTGANAGIFYPYNGFILKVAGLFADARIFLSNTPPISDGTSHDTALTEYKNYLKMPGGILIAKRYIAPITKDHSTSITARWTLYL